MSRLFPVIVMVAGLVMIVFGLLGHSLFRDEHKRAETSSHRADSLQTLLDSCRTIHAKALISNRRHAGTPVRSYSAHRMNSESHVETDHRSFWRRGGKWLIVGGAVVAGIVIGHNIRGGDVAQAAVIRACDPPRYTDHHDYPHKKPKTPKKCRW